ncbi:MAG: hypothetical protein ACRDTU_11295 [Micromonosporaceae bacterium]
MALPTGKDLAVNLEKLLYVARRDLPAAADVYLDANGHAADTAEVDKAAFLRPQESHSGSHDSPGQVYPAWAALRDELQMILGETADALIDTGRALEMVVDVYTDTDAEAAAALKNLIRDETDPNNRDAMRNRIADLPEPEMPKG